MRVRAAGAGLQWNWLSLAALFWVLAFGGIAQGQFNGPSLGASTPVNLPVTPTADPAILYPAAREFRVGPGDVLSVRLYGTTEYAQTERVGFDGTIRLPLIGTLRAQGLTAHQIADLVATKLTDAGMYRDPQVTVMVTESPNQIVTVIGELHGVVPLPNEKRLFDVLSTVGGLPPTASHLITINRPGVDQPIIVDLGTDPSRSARADVPVFAGDTIVVSRVGVVYLIGAFKTQGAIPIQQNSPLTLMQVAALGGGPGFEGKANDLRIIRTIGVDRKVVHVDIKKIMNGQEPDPVLQTDDIVFLPTDAMKAAIKSGGISTLLGIASIIILAYRP
jgi:polysaccharide export outer membrane protein